MNTQKIITRFPLFLLGLSLLASSAAGQVFDTGPSDSALFDNVINLPPEPDFGDDASVGDDGATTQLNLSDGGSIGRLFDAGSGSEVNISGGTVGDRFDANSGSEVNISGGTVAEFFGANSGSEVNITGGIIESFFVALDGSEVNISGGVFGNFFSNIEGSVVNISGGRFGVDFGGFAGGDLELIGGEFRLNGADFSGGTISLANEDVLTGTLADGSPFIFSENAFDRLTDATLTVVPLPAADPTPIVINDPIVSGPPGLRAGQTLTLTAGGVLGDNFSVVDATVSVEDGTVGSGFEAYNSEVNISGGTFEGGFDADTGSEVNISSGSFGLGFDAYVGSVVNISGGTFGVAFEAHAGSDLELIGGEFRLNGADFSGGTISLANEDVLTGTLADGSPFIFSENAFDRLTDATLTVVPLPAADPTPIVINDPIVSGPPGLRAGQTLTLTAGGVLGDNFSVVDATVSVEDGTVSDGFEAYNSEVNISGGTFEGRFDALAESEVNISGGTFVGVGVFSNSLDARDGSEVNISGGIFDSGLSVVGDSDGGTVNISGGIFDARVESFDRGVINVSGGTIDIIGALNFESVVNISGGTVSSIREGSGTVNISGSEFSIDGLDLDTLVLGEAFTVTDRDVTLSGVLADGEQFSFDIISPNQTYTVTLVSEAGPQLGDFDQDGDVDADDIDFYSGNLDLPATGALAQLDLDGDQTVTLADHDLHVTTLAETSNGQTGALLGDVNLDGSVDVLNDAFAFIGGLGTATGGYANGDLNADEVVDVLGDGFRLIGNLGQSNDPG